MGKRDKLLVKILLGTMDANSPFDPLRQLLSEMKFKYEPIIYWSDADDAFIVEVPELPGCAADGESYQEAVQNAEIVTQEWIETAQELGRVVPQPKGRLLFA